MTSLNLGSDWIPRAVAIVALTLLAIWFGSLGREPVKGGPLPIVRLELAYTVKGANDFIGAWKLARDSWQTDLDKAQRWDTWLICAYAPLFALLCWTAAAHLSSSFPRLATVGFVLAPLQLVAGALDFLENACINKTINAGYATAPWPLIGATASSAKWLLLALFVVYGLVATTHWLVGIVRHSL